MRVDASIVIPGRGEPINDGAVVFDAGTISYVGPADGAPGEASQSVPAVMPGVWDVHGHLLGITELDLEYEAKTHPALRAARATAAQ